MANEVGDRARSVWEKISRMEWGAFTLMDFIFVAGVVTLAIVALKIVRRFFKVVFWLLAVALLIFWLMSRGVIG